MATRSRCVGSYPARLFAWTGLLCLLVSALSARSASAGTVSGTITLQDVVNSVQPVIFDFVPTNGGNALTFVTVLNAGGGYSLPNVPAGTYTVGVKGRKWLHKVLPNAINTTTNVSGVNASLLGGDADDNNVVDFDDLTILATAYNTAVGNPLYDERADFNCDGQVEFADLTILATNDNLSGDPYAAKAVVVTNLTLNPGSVTGGSGTVGTVTLNYAASSAVAVTVKSSSPSVTINGFQTATVQVPAGSNTTTFNVATTAFTEPTSVTLSASCNNWIQATMLMVLPGGYSLTVQNLDAVGGNGCVILSWTDLPEGSIQGYYVYRQIGNTTSRLTTVPQQAPIYADTGLTNGSAYMYRVSIVNIHGQEVGFSNWISVTPSASAPTMNWVNPPTTVTGYVRLFASLSSGRFSVGNLMLIDGKIASSGGVGGPQTVSLRQTQVELDTSELPDGIHTVQLVGYVGNGKCATSPLQLQIANDISNFALENTFEPLQGEAVLINASKPANAVQWTLQILDGNNAVVRSWQGTSAMVHLAWNGTDVSGTVVSEDDYTILLTTSDAQGNTKQQKKHLALVKGSPNALALIEKTSGNPNDDQMLADTMKAQFKKMKTTIQDLLFKSSAPSTPQQKPTVYVSESG